MDPLSNTADRRVASIASRQHGVVTRSQLLAHGLSPDEVRGRLRRGVLLRVHPGVYRVGHAAPSSEALYLAGVLACGRGATLSGRAAGFLWRLLKGRPPPPEVTSPRQRRVRGVRTHRSVGLRLAFRRGIPVTPVPWTLVDLAALSRRASWPGLATKQACCTARRPATSRRSWPSAPPCARHREAAGDHERRDPCRSKQARAPVPAPPQGCGSPGAGDQQARWGP